MLPLEGCAMPDFPIPSSLSISIDDIKWSVLCMCKKLIISKNQSNKMLKVGVMRCGPTLLDTRFGINSSCLRPGFRYLRTLVSYYLPLVAL